MSIPLSPSSSSQLAPDNNSYFATTLLVLCAILLVRLVSLYFNTTNLFFDEAQYWLWGKEPAFGYFSKPPVLGWTIAVFTAICTSDSEFCVRLPSPIIHTATALLIYLSAARLFDVRTGFWSAITFALLPGITLSSTLISTDVPLLFFWAGAFWAFLRFYEKQSWGNAALLGLFLGAGMMAKYAMIYFLLCMLLFAIFEKSARKTILTPKFLFALLIALLILAPNLWWNAQHQFITASHTGDNIGWRGGLHPLKMLEFLGSQFGVFGPVPFAFLLIALVRFWIEGWDKVQKILVLFSVPVLALVTFQALMSKAYANWAAVTYIAASILIADLLVNRVPSYWNKISVAIHTIAFAGLSIAVAFSAPGYLTLANGKEPFARLHGWSQIGEVTRVKLAQGNYSAVIGPQRHLTAELVYYLKDSPQKVFALKPEATPSDHYELTRPYLGKPAGPVLLVTPSQSVGRYLQQFSSVEPRGTAKLTAGKYKQLWFFELDGYGQ